MSGSTSSTSTEQTPIPFKLYQDWMNIKTHYYRILEDIKISQNGPECFTKDQIVFRAHNRTKTQLVDHLSDILCSLQAMCLSEDSTDDNSIPEEYKHKEKRNKTEHVEKDTKPQLFYSGNAKKLSLYDESIIIEGYNKKYNYKIADASEEQPDNMPQYETYASSSITASSLQAFGPPLPEYNHQPDNIPKQHYNPPCIPQGSNKSCEDSGWNYQSGNKIGGYQDWYAKRSSSISMGPPTGRKHCTFFKQPTGCRLGSMCGYIHDNNAPKSGNKNKEPH